MMIYHKIWKNSSSNSSSTTSTSTAHQLQKKGLLTVLLIVLGESITLTNAVQFWSTYQNWSNLYGRGRFANSNQYQHEEGDCSSSSSSNGDSGSTSTKADHIGKLFFSNKLKHPSKECLVSNNSNNKKQINSNYPTSSTTSKSPLSSRLHPRQLARAAASSSSVTIGKNQRVCSTAMYNCCNSSCPSCIHLDIRGGHNDSPSVASTVAEAVLTGATTTAAAAATTGAATLASTSTPYNIPLNGWKIIFQIFLTALNVMCWLIPLRAKKISENKLALGIANAFSGGVFLTLAFGHLIPECVHGFEGYSSNESLPYMIVLGGYLLIFFVEKVAFDAHGLMHEGEEHDHGHANGNAKAKKLEDDVKGNVEPVVNVGRSAVILLGALAVHSVLEMTALGLARSFGDSALLTLSIALHQPAESIALLVAFLKSGMPKPDIVKFLSVFSACGPIGVAIGMAVNEFAAPIIDSIMLATVAGTFIYVGATEVIPEEWEEQEHKWKKFLALISGIVSIYAITQYTMTLEGHAH